MAALQLRVLGDLEVIRGDAVLELPPSRKTRGLLAYLALTARPVRREQLCELLWEIPDDPRGSLRWSLSKIRKLVDDEDCPRIIANRSTVAFDTSAVGIDVLALHRISANVESASEEELQHAARSYQGTFLDGLDLTDFHDFQAWCIGERQRTIRSQARVLQALVKRLADQPERALEHAVALVGLNPFEESPRAELIRLLVHLDRQEEARHHFHVGREKLAELGVQESGALGRALREPRRVARSSDAIPTATPQQAALVGRDAEIELLGERINNLASSGSARLLLISGEPGIGKSSLLQVAAAIARRAGARIFRASAFESEKLRPFGVWSDALRRGLPDNNPAHRFLASGEQITREQVFSSLVDIFKVETGKGPVVVLCDDCQWADESSWSAVHYLLRNHPRQPLLFIGGCRDAELREHTSAQTVLRGLRADGLLEEIRLQPLSAQQIERLIRAKFPHAEAHALAAECGGNPLLALELARAGVEGIRSLTELVGERLSRLDANAQTVLHWAAVLAPRINIGSLESASGLAREVIDEALQKAEQQGMLHPGERGLRFSHELVRSSLYELIPPARRRAMHRHAAELLEVEAGVDLELAADLAHHAQLSGDPCLACRAAVSAGKMCIRFYANDQAMELYRQGMETAAQLGEAQRICLSLELAEVRFNAQHIEDWHQEVEHFVQLAEQAMDHGSPAHARLGYQMASYLRWAHGEWQGAKRFSLQAQRVARGATDSAQILGMAEAAKCLALLERDLSQADAMAMEARALAQRLAYSCPAIPLALGILRYYEHKFDDAIECLEDARALAKTDGDKLSEFLANEYLAMVEVERGDCATAAQYADNLVAIGERMRDGSERPFSHALHALCDAICSGEECVLEPALDELRAADAKQRLAFLLNRAAIQYLQRGELQKAIACASEALQLAHIMERPSEVLQAYITLEYVHRRNRDLAPDSVREHIERLASAGVAGWVKARAHALLGEPV